MGALKDFWNKWKWILKPIIIIIIVAAIVVGVVLLVIRLKKDKATFEPFSKGVKLKEDFIYSNNSDESEFNYVKSYLATARGE